jgi:hypothetical protein
LPRGVDTVRHCVVPRLARLASEKAGRHFVLGPYEAKPLTAKEGSGFGLDLSRRARHDRHWHFNPLSAHAADAGRNAAS